MANGDERRTLALSLPVSPSPCHPVNSVSGLICKTTDDYRAADYTAPVVLLMGSERYGLSPELQTLCDAMVYIPMSDAATRSTLRSRRA
jgi:tRNA(Leu) C34 or U34 (ribose-2'-O)-methylase TrmL